MNKNKLFLPVTLITVLSMATLNAMDSELLPSIIITRTQAERTAQKHARIRQELATRITAAMEPDNGPKYPKAGIHENQPIAQSTLHKNEPTPEELLEGARELLLVAQHRLAVRLWLMNHTESENNTQSNVALMRKEVKHINWFIQGLEYQIAADKNKTK